jgi:hypothetical protein
MQRDGDEQLRQHGKLRQSLRRWADMPGRRDDLLHAQWRRVRAAYGLLQYELQPEPGRRLDLLLQSEWRRLRDVHRLLQHVLQPRRWGGRGRVQLGRPGFVLRGGTSYEAHEER